MQKGAITRIRLLTGAVLLLSILLLVHLYYIQIVQHAEFAEITEGQYIKKSNDLYARGNIFMQAKNGELVSAATVNYGYLLAINPRMMTDADAAWAVVSEAVLPKLDEITFKNIASQKERAYVVLEERLSEAVADKIDSAKVDGVIISKNQWRYYPGESVGAKVIGFVGHTSNPEDGLKGKYGLERYYDSVLSREKSGPSVNLFAEIFNNFGVTNAGAEEEKRGSVVTTIEPTVQRMLDRVLLETNEYYQSKSTGGIIMDPKTGEIVALDAVPTYNNNDRSQASIEAFQNPLVENVYEMGSTIKALTMAAGLDSGVVTPTSTYYDAGTLTLNTFTIGNYDGRGRGTVDMQEVLNQSLNTGVAHITKLMGHERFRDYFTRMKIGSETGIDLPSEARGLVSNLESPREVEYATASFGQGIATTPIATTRALAALGNGGYLVTPHLVSRIEYEDGTSKDILYPQGQQVFSNETSETISRMLVTVVDKALRGGSVALPNHTIAAKTGTAQIAKPGGGYYDDRYFHSFFGYFPAYDPKYIIFLYTVEPKGVQYASETLTEPFMDLTKFLINYYSIPPDR